MINTAIKWLFQRTSDGATYLQVLVVGVLLFIIFKAMVNTVKEIYVSLHEGEKYDSEEM